MRAYRTHVMVSFILAAFCLAPCPCPCVALDRSSVLAASNDGTDFLGETKGDQKFLVLRRGGHRADLAVFIHGRLIYTMPDEALDLPSEHFDPGETYKGYDFYLSPDHQNLLVVRGLVRSLAAAYLYARSGPGRMKAVRPGGLRLDEAALRDYCQHRRVNERLLAGGGRIVRFVGWNTARHRLVFSVWAASSWGGGNPVQATPAPSGTRPTT